MRAERNRIASRFRAEGDEKELKIRADADKQATIIKAEAQKTSNEIRGEGEAEAISILAESLNKDPDFFAFRKSLEAYKNILSSDTTVILSAESDIFKFLEGPYITK
jgi:membrane protease subunit HflC